MAAAAPVYSDSPETAPFETATTVTAFVKQATAEPGEISAFVTCADEAGETDAAGPVSAFDPVSTPGAEADISAAGKLNLLGLLEGVGVLSDGSRTLQSTVRPHARRQSLLLSV